MGLANLIPTVKGVGYFGGQILTSWRIGSINIGGGQSLTSAFLLDGVGKRQDGRCVGSEHVSDYRFHRRIQDRHQCHVGRVWTHDRRSDQRHQ